MRDNTNNLKFTNIVKSEFIKLTGKTLFKVIIGIIIALTMFMFAFSIYRFKEQVVWTSPFNMISNPTLIFFTVLFITLVCEEYTKGFGLITYTLVPNRNKVILAKLMVLMITYCIAITILFALTFVSSFITSSIYGYTMNFNVEYTSIIMLMLPLLINLLLGFALAILTKETTIALVLYFVLPVFTVIGTQIPKIGKFVKWVSLEHSSSLFIGGATGVSTYQYISSVIIWILVPMIIGIYRNRVMDIG